MRNERAEFSQRLAAAMRAAGYEPRPSVLFKQFNYRFEGTSVAFQTASRWLRGGGIPEHAKLVVLADWLKQSPDFLLFGERAAPGRNGRGRVEEDGPIYDEQRMFTVYRTLPAAQQKIVCDLVLALAAIPSRRLAGKKGREEEQASDHG